MLLLFLWFFVVVRFDFVVRFVVVRFVFVVRFFEAFSCCFLILLVVQLSIILILAVISLTLILVTEPLILFEVMLKLQQRACSFSILTGQENGILNFKSFENHIKKAILIIITQ